MSYTTGRYARSQEPVHAGWPTQQEVLQGLLDQRRELNPSLRVHAAAATAREPSVELREASLTGALRPLA